MRRADYSLKEIFKNPKFQAIFDDIYMEGSKVEKSHGSA